MRDADSPDGVLAALIKKVRAVELASGIGAAELRWMLSTHLILSILIALSNSTHSGESAALQRSTQTLSSRYI